MTDAILIVPTMDNSIQVESISLVELLAKKLTIPEYQRPYVWQFDDVDKLIRQIEVHAEQKNSDKPMHYLGSIVLHEDNDGNLNIIDGQQRITTVSIINYVKTKSDFGITYDNINSQQNIKKNYEYLELYREKLIQINFEEINVTVIITRSQDAAYNFFETLNTGGKRLSGIDVIKAHHLRCVKNDINKHAIAWEKDQHHIADVIKLLLKARKWSFLNFENVPSRRGGMDDWKKIITNEFSQKTSKDHRDVAYSFLKKENNNVEYLNSMYSIRQPISDGENFIHYLISFVDLYKQLFVFDDIEESDFYYKFNQEVINVIDCTIDLKALYQLALLCYASRFGLDKIIDSSLLIFRFVYSLRVSVTKAIQEKTAINHCRENVLIDRILYSFSENEVLSWLDSFEYEVKSDNLKGTKGRFVYRTKSIFKFEVNDNISDFDIQLKREIKNRITKK